MGGGILMPKVYVDFNENGEIIGWAHSRGTETEVEFEIDEAHPFFNQNPFYFKNVNGELVYQEDMRERKRVERTNRREIMDLKEMLKETDFYFIRKMDEGTAIPGEVQSKRAQARKRLKELGL